MPKHIVFIYGTLKKGQPNEYFMNLRKSLEYLGPAVTSSKYPLIIGDQWNLPMLLNVPGNGMKVKGELYEVDDEDLLELDRFEGHPDLYKRTEICALKSGDEETVRCWTYFINKYSDSDLSLPHHETYDSNGEHGFKYDVSENDDHPDSGIT